MKIIICDVCGKELKNPKADYDTGLVISWGGTNVMRDICEECRKSFVDWANGRKIKERG